MLLVELFETVVLLGLCKGKAVSEIDSCAAVWGEKRLTRELTGELDEKTKEAFEENGIEGVGCVTLPELLTSGEVLRLSSREK